MLFFKAEKQSLDYAGKQKDGSMNKPFAMVAMPHGTGDGIVLCRLSEIKRVVEGLEENWKQLEEE